MAKFFKYLWASAGDKTAIPETTQGDGSVSYQQGYGFDYQRDPVTDPLHKNIERDKMNELFYDMTGALAQYQTHGVPDFITTSDNGGTPYSYGVSAIVRYDDGGGFGNYVSLVDSNTALPTDTTKWQRIIYNNAIPTGTLWAFDLNTLPSGGWIWANGQTIGSAASGANYANAAAQALFIATWTDYPNAVRPILDSSGAPSTRGASANADWVANKRLPVRDTRERVLAGHGTMGGTTSPGLLTSADLLGVDGSVLGASGGEQLHTLTTGEMPSHTHGITGYAALNQNLPLSNWTKLEAIEGVSSSGATDPTGGGTSHNNVQPTTISNFILKL